MPWNNYEAFIDWAARAKFENNGPAILTDEQAPLLANWSEEHPNMMDEVEEKAEKYRKIAATHRENQSPEYLIGLDKYNQIINDIKLTIEPVEYYPNDEKPLSYFVTDEQRQSLTELLYVGVEVDLRRDIGAPLERFSNNLQEQTTVTR